jgi:hypothetical protein
MSAKFRDSLRRLCEMQKLPPDIPSKKLKVIKTMCKQLKEADSRTTLGLAAENGSPLVFFACCGFVAFYFYTQQQQPQSEPTAPTESATAAQTAAAREARLKMYEERPKLTEEQQQMLMNLKCKKAE